MAQELQIAESRRTRIAVLVLILLLTGSFVAFGCGQGNDEGQGDGQDDPGAISTAPATSTTSTTVTTNSERGSPDGSDPDELTDGTHQVRVDSVDATAQTITVDGIEVLLGTEAVLAYLADTDGNQLEGPQVYVRNQRGKLQDLPVDPEGEFAVIFGPTCCEPQDLGWKGFAELANSGFPDVWGKAPPFEATVTDGTVTSLVQTYIP